MKESPQLSVVVIVASDTVNRRRATSLLDSTLDALMRQMDPPSLEVIVPYHPLTTGIAALQDRYPAVRFIRVALAGDGALSAGHEHHHRLRAAGIRQATGEIVALTEDSAQPARDWCRRIVEAHERYDAVGGAIENNSDRSLNWAIYFADFGRYSLPLIEGEARSISDTNSSYKRSLLSAVESSWADGFREPAVNAAVIATGRSLRLTPAVVVTQRRGELRLGESLIERFVWGRSYGAQRARVMTVGRRAAYVLLSPGLPLLLIGRIGAKVFHSRRNVADFLRSLPFAVVLAAIWTAGEATGYVTGRVPDTARSHGDA